MNAVTDTKTTKRTAAETVLLAAASFDDREFTKWELAIAAWKLDPMRFGMRGFESQYPDTHRMMMEIVGQKRTSPIVRGLMEYAGTSTYRITSNGKALAVALGSMPLPKDSEQSNGIYGAVAEISEHPAFLRWRANPAEPRDVAPARDCLAGFGGIDGARQMIAAARDWCRSKGIEFMVWYVPPNPHVALVATKLDRAPIHVTDLADLDDFLTAMGYRFPGLAAPKGRRA